MADARRPASQSQAPTESGEGGFACGPRGAEPIAGFDVDALQLSEQIAAGGGAVAVGGHFQWLEHTLNDRIELFQPIGELDMAGASRLADAVERAIRSGRRLILFDLLHLSH